ncbi:hypothetical protein L9F63_025423, partial [Diploptera punctata]
TNNVLMCRHWWKVCWIYGDQEKYYRQLYGRRTTTSTVDATLTTATTTTTVFSLHSHDQNLSLHEITMDGSSSSLT